MIFLLNFNIYRFILNLNNQIRKEYDTYQVARKIIFSEDTIQGKYVNQKRESPDFGRHLIPPRSHYCPFCKSLMWIEEKLSSSSFTNPKFGICCLQGSIDIPHLNQMPNEILQIIKNDKQFRSSIRLYNRILAFTSTSANVDDSLLRANTGTYTYRINGAVHH